MTQNLINRKLLKQLRDRYLPGLGRQTVSRLMGISYYSLYACEEYSDANPQLETVAIICAFYNVRLDELVDVSKYKYYQDTLVTS